MVSNLYYTYRLNLKSLWTICLLFPAALALSGETRRVHDPRIIIIGGGVSGVAAASCLGEFGFRNVTVLEAEGRLGGRIHSVPFGDNYVDLGAHWVHGQVGNIVYKLASQYDLVESLNKTEHFQFFSDDKDEIDPVFGTELMLASEGFLEDEESLAKFNGSLADYILPRLLEIGKKKIKDQEMLNVLTDWIMTIQCVVEGCHSLKEVSAKGLLDFSTCPGDTATSWKKKGYHTIIDILMKKYPPTDDPNGFPVEILLNTSVKQIDWSGAAPLVKCSNGKTYEADHVIVTVSLAVLKERHQELFIPPLPERKVTAIRGLGMGTINKIILEFPHQWWPDELSGFGFLRKNNQSSSGTSELNWEKGILGFFSDYTAPRVLYAWLIGDTAREAEIYSDDVVLEASMRVLNKYLGHKYSIPRPKNILRSKWFSNPHFRGSYSFRSMDAELLNTGAHQLSEPLKNVGGKQTILFAGEATHSNHYSTVHGGLESGCREALRLAAFYK